jgi:F0F1-type ATP synthase membrane subunit c/vacuolar-type H+-ATPase subunit K
MTPAAAQADRNAAVRAAARGWKGAGAIDDASLAAVDAAYPDDRQRVGPVFRILLFLFTLLSINGALGFAFALAGSASKIAYPVLLLLFGVALVAATEFLINGMRRALGGIESATSLEGLGYLIGFVAWFCFETIKMRDDHAIAVTLLAAAVLMAVAAWRWGYPIYAGLAMAALLGCVAFLPFGRLLWIALPLAAAPWLARSAGSARLPPALRASCSAALAVGLTGLYVAVHVGSFDSGLIETVSRNWRSQPASTSAGLRGLAIVATALVPAVYLALGLRSRRWVFLILGLGTAVASLVTLRWYVHLAPLWTILTLSGAALVAVVFALRSYLESGPEGERHGFTAEPLFEDMARRRLLEAGATLLSLSPDARPIHDEPKYTGGGGSFGGGGSSSEF